LWRIFAPKPGPGFPDILIKPAVPMYEYSLFARGH
jgi:hypothetical protein